MIASWLVLLACHPTHEPPDDSSGTGTGTLDTGHFVVPDPTVGVVRVSSDTTTYADIGYQIDRYEMSVDAEDPYLALPDQAPYDQQPYFYVVAPIGASMADDLPVLMWIHGAALADDSEGQGANCLDIDTHVVEFITQNELNVRYAAQRGWAIVAPAGLWCDGWHGLGPSDPVDSTHHFGYYHVARVLDFLRAGGAGFHSGRLMTWGTSAGAAATILIANHYGRIDRQIVDSQIGDMLLFYQQDPATARHVLGGPPYNDDGSESAYYAHYLEESANVIVAKDAYRVPMFVDWNREDRLAWLPFQTSLFKAIDPSYESKGIIWGNHDFNHLYPGAGYHVQTIGAYPPTEYNAGVEFQFLDGKTIAWAEAEAGCTDGACVAGSVVTSTDPDSPIEACSGASAIESSGPGVIYTGTLPAQVPGGKSVKATLVLVASVGAIADGSPVLTASYDEGGEAQSVILTTHEFAPDGSTPRSNGQALAHQVDATALTFTTTDPAKGRLTVTAAEGAVLRLDAIVYAWTP